MNTNVEIIFGCNTLKNLPGYFPDITIKTQDQVIVFHADTGFETEGDAQDFVAMVIELFKQTPESEVYAQ